MYSIKMKIRVSVILWASIALAAFIWINLSTSTVLWDVSSWKYQCYNYGGEYYCNLDSEQGEYDCVLSEETWRSCSKEWWSGRMYCNEDRGDWEWEWNLYCTPYYICDEEEGIYHCRMSNEPGWYQCDEEEWGDSDLYQCYSYEWDEPGYCNSCNNWLGTCDSINDWNEYYCYGSNFSITSVLDKWWYYFDASQIGNYSCYAWWWEWAARLWLRSYHYTPWWAYCDWGSEDEWYNYYYCSYEWNWRYFCPQLYSFDKNIAGGEYIFEEDYSSDYHCLLDGELDAGAWEGDDWEDDMLLAKWGNITDNTEQYYCYYMWNSELEYNRCTPKNDGNGYSCPIYYSCTETESNDWHICKENAGWEYSCKANPTGGWVLKGPRNNEMGEYSCYYSNGDLLSNNCSYENNDFYCPFDVEKYTITISANDSWYWSVNPSWEINNIPSWTEILIDENNVLTIWGNEVVATPTASTPEYTYSLSGWTNTCGDTLTWNCTITANFSRTANKYTITFVDGDRTYVYTWAYWSNVSVTAPSWTKEWYSLTWEGAIPSTMPAENVNITAQWTINQYTITFNYNGGTGTPVSITQDYNTAVSEPTEPIREWYTFAGWYDGNNPVSFPYTIPASNKTLTAHWSWNNSWWNGNNSWWGGYSWRWWHSWGWNSDNNHGSADDKPKVDDKPTNPQSSGDDKNIIPSSDVPDIQKGWNENKEWNKPQNEKYTQEVYDVYEWAYKNWLTKYADISEARLDEYLNRSEMAKISTIFATQFRWETPDEEKKEFCSRFSDLWKVEEDTKEYIIQSCELWNMWYQANGVDELQRFRPYTPVSLAEASIILSRMMRWNKYAVSENKWYQWHLWAAYEHRLIDNISKPFNNITRKEAFMMLYKMSSSDVLRD